MQDELSVETSGAVASWHATRRRLITEELGRETIAKLSAAQPRLTLSVLTLVDICHVSVACTVSTWEGWWWLLAATTVGAWLSLVQFALLHDVLHGPKKHRSKIFWLSMPCVFGYWLYLELGHLQHHAATGDSCGKELFASEARTFEDGDVFFVSHRQETSGGRSDDPEIISISRFAYRNFWGHSLLANIASYAWSMLTERAALGFHDKVVAISGYNLFFPKKPLEFHELCASYARYGAAVQLAIFAVGGWKAIMYLLISETFWQLPPFPAAALFLSNHGLRSTDRRGVGGAHDGWPTHSVYGSRLFDLLCCNANYHLEHHDFPAMPLWNLPILRAKAGTSWYPDTPTWKEILSDAFDPASAPIVYPKWSRDELPPPALGFRCRDEDTPAEASVAVLQR